MKSEDNLKMSLYGEKANGEVWIRLTLQYLHTNIEVQIMFFVITCTKKNCDIRSVLNNFNGKLCLT